MTAQVADHIRINGADHALYSEPLEAYFQTHERPTFAPQSTANWRKYIAGWEIRDGKLYLTDIAAELCRDPPPMGQCTHRTPFTLADLVHSKKPGKVFAEWYTGVLRVPMGEMLKYTHMGYESVYEFDLLIVVENGKVKSTTTKDNRAK